MADVVDMDLDRFNKDCIELTTTSHFLRYVTELMGMGRAKGVVGRVNVLMTIDIVPSVDLVEKILQKFPLLSREAAMTHPTLVHHFRFEENGTRAGNKEPTLVNHSWKLEYIIDGNMNVWIRNKECILDNKRPDVVREEQVGSLSKDEKGFFLRLTKDASSVFCLSPVRPKLRSSGLSEFEPTIDGVLTDKLSNETEEVRNIIKSFYSKRNARNITVFRVRVQFRSESCLLLEWGTSEDIRDTKIHQTGAMDIHGVTNLKSCYSGGRKVTITSEWYLDRKTVEPRLHVFDERGTYLENMTKELNQPSDFKVGTLYVDFLSPSQTADKIEKIYYEMVGTEKRRTGNVIKLLLKRSESKSDGFESNKKVTFQYIPCHDNCDYCIRDVDGDRVDSL